MAMIKESVCNDSAAVGLNQQIWNRIIRKGFGRISGTDPHHIQLINAADLLFNAVERMLGNHERKKRRDLNDSLRLVRLQFYRIGSGNQQKPCILFRWLITIEYFQ